MTSLKAKEVEKDLTFFKTWSSGDALFEYHKEISSPIPDVIIMRFVSFDAFLEDFPSAAVADIRPGDLFQKGRLPGAVHLPVLFDPVKVKNRLLSARDARTSDLIENARNLRSALNGLSVQGACLFYCEDGGVRSRLLGSYLAEMGVKGYFLQGGLNGYREEQARFFARPLQVHLLTGLTGSGKTGVLKALGDCGEQVVDLEALAGSTGSVFGVQSNENQPDEEAFRRLLQDKLRTLNPEKRIFFEQKGPTLGALSVPEGLFRQFATARKIRLTLPADERIRNLVAVYGAMTPAAARTGLDKIRKNLSADTRLRCLAALEAGDIRRFIAAILPYYDRAKGYATDREDCLVIETGGMNAREIAGKILENIR